jgi:hypothetical protein
MCVRDTIAPGSLIVASPWHFRIIENSLCLASILNGFKFALVHNKYIFYIKFYTLFNNEYSIYSTSRHRRSQLLAQFVLWNRTLKMATRYFIKLWILNDFPIKIILSKILKVVIIFMDCKNEATFCHCFSKNWDYF